ncbi:hypothetical protein [Desulfovibrio sp. JC010]|uniref:hypothetical protein n=1 Tax=Desulfovibrio sp. JC010 TaxID=2593641 RepID=UPI0013D62D12|nr:hypothetical protein [Desulfovibrio sp. JC010]NDV28788.1 hypothetical protein [Desulfovibrio sp. JC010]
MSISDEYLAKQLRKKFNSYEEAAKALGYSGYRPFRNAIVKGLPEAKRKLALMLLLEEPDEQK